VSYRSRSRSRDDRRSRHYRKGDSRSRSRSLSSSYNRRGTGRVRVSRQNRDRDYRENENRDNNRARDMNRERDVDEGEMNQQRQDKQYGVVSDDENHKMKPASNKSSGRDDHHTNNESRDTTRLEKDKADMEREERKRRKKKKAKRKRSRERDRDRDRDRQKDDAGRRRGRDGGRHHDAKGRKGRASSGGSVSSGERDDSFGHFEGGPGTIIHGRYKLLKDVGLGTFGRVVQAIDLNQLDRKDRDRDRDRDRKKTRMEDTVAIKIVRSVKRYHESALIEADIVKDVNSRGGRGQSLIAVMLRQFDLPQGHCCLVFECLGRSLYDFMKVHGFKPFPLFCVRDFARQLLDALDFIHSFGLIHTDLKPENILLKHNKERPYRCPDGSDQQVPASTSIKLIDFGGATYDRDKKSTVINTRQYRAPEVILGLGWSFPSDLWSAGCIIAELYKGGLLFETHDNSEHLALIERIIGRLPLDMVSRSKEFGEVFDAYGWHKMELPASSKSHVRKMAPLDLFVKEEDKDSGLGQLLSSLLTIDPSLRSTASDALKAPFFAKEAKKDT